MRIITISRQFGSGGRELGKRLSDILGWDYYDKEIIEQLAEQQELDPKLVRHALSNHEWHNYQLTYRNSFSNAGFYTGRRAELLRRQRELIESIAAAGNDCIIVGRDADVILSTYRPFRVFICADTESRIARCMKHEMKKEPSARLTEKEIARNIRQIDKSRSQVRELLTGKKWGDGSAFDLTLNATGRDIKALSSAVADFALRWFEEDERQQK